MQKKEVKWSEVLGVGESAAVSASELAARLGVTDKREVRRKVAEARLCGVPVCSLQRSDKGSGGYFMPDLEHIDEVHHVMAELKKRAITSLRMVKSLNEWLKNNSGDALLNTQMSIDDFLIGGDDGSGI